MRIAPVFALTIAALPSCSAQDCVSLCVEGERDESVTGAFLYPGYGVANCAAGAPSLIEALDLSPEECTMVHAAAFLVCGCPSPPPPNTNLLCTFCSDGSLPTNPKANIDPPVAIPDSGIEVTDCNGLVALASLPDTNATLCAQIKADFAETCGCAAVEEGQPPVDTSTVVQGETTTATTVQATTIAAEETISTSVTEEITTASIEGTISTVATEEATTDTPEETTTVAVLGPGASDEPGTTVDTMTTVVDETSSSVPIVESEAPSLAPSTETPMDSNMPASGDAETEMPVAEGGSLTPSPTILPTSSASFVSTIAGSTILGMTLSITM